MAKGYLPYDLNQRILLPPDMRSWFPEGHLALFVLDVVSELTSVPSSACTTRRTRVVAPDTTRR